MRLLLLAIALWLAPAAVGAQVTTPPDIPPGEDRIEAMDPGERAPFAGMLLDTDTSIRWTNRLLWWRETFQLRLDERSAVLDALRRSHDTELRVLRESLEREIDGLRSNARELMINYEQQLQRYRSPPFYEQWGFAFGMGALVVAVAGALVAGLAVGL